MQQLIENFPKIDFTNNVEYFSLKNIFILIFFTFFTPFIFQLYYLINIKASNIFDCLAECSFFCPLSQNVDVFMILAQLLFFFVSKTILT